MKKRLITATIALSTLLAATQLFAGAGKNSYIDTAKVLDVEPIYETVTHAIPEESCWKKPHRDKHQRSNRYQSRENKSYTGAIAGGILGGVVGNQFGHGSGKKVMTVAGSLLGMSIGHDLSQETSYRSDDYGYNNQTKHRKRGRKHRCETTTRYESREEIAGYRVKYRYKGNTFWTQTQSHPGKRMKIRVKVRPLHDDF
ncbi:glycine zipper 2TM domain-containing protein [Pseudomonadota bacterium]